MTSTLTEAAARVNDASISSPSAVSRIVFFGALPVSPILWLHYWRLDHPVHAVDVADVLRAGAQPISTTRSARETGAS